MVIGSQGVAGMSRGGYPTGEEEDVLNKRSLYSVIYSYVDRLWCSSER